MTSPIDDLARALDATGQVIDGIRDDEWARPTPCTEWDVRSLTGHLIRGNLLFSSALRGEETDWSPGAQPGADTRADGVTAADYRRSAEALLAAFGEPGALDRPVSVPIGTVPGGVALLLRVTEQLVHGWDLARAVGRPARFPEDLAERTLAFTRARLADVPPGRSPFGPPQPAPDEAPAIDRLAALLGRPLEPTATGAE